MSRSVIRKLAALVLLATVGAFPASGQCDPDLVVQLLADPPLSFDEFGADVELHGDVLMVGSTEADDVGTNAGRVTAFRYSPLLGWTQEGLIHHPDPSPNLFFGRHLAVAGDVLVAGTSNYDPPGGEINAGGVMVFRFDPDQIAWIPEANLTPPIFGESDFFGASVDTDGEVIVAATRSYDGAAQDSGIVLVFRRDPAGVWQQEAELVGPSPSFQDFFGYSVSLSNDRIAVGAPWEDTAGPNFGVVYIYELQVGSGQWELASEVLPPPDTIGFGQALALEGDRLAVRGGDQDTFAKRLAIYDWQAATGQWITQAQFSSPDANIGSLGVDDGLDLSGDTVVLSCSSCLGPGGQGAPRGWIGVFHRDENTGEWLQEASLDSPTATEQSQFGAWLALHGNTLAAGAPLDGDVAFNAGSVFVYDTGCDAVSFHRGDANDTGTVDLGDVVFLLAALFVAGSPQPLCTDAADFNDDGIVALDDGIGKLGFLFLMGAPPAPPHPGCGADPSDDDLECFLFESCP